MPSYESFEKKLHNPRDSEGKPNADSIHQIRELEHRLATHPAFVGLGLYGSTFSGYSTEESDLDVRILYDASPGDASKSAYDELEKMANRVQDEHMIDRKRCIGFQLQNINAEAMLHDLEIDSTEVKALALTGMVDLFLKVTGAKINGYRNRIADYIGTLPPDKAEHIKNEIVDRLMRKELLRMPKLTERIPGIKEKEAELLGARKKLWRDRVEKLLKSTEPEITAADPS